MQHVSLDLLLPTLKRMIDRMTEAVIIIPPIQAVATVVSGLVWTRWATYSFAHAAVASTIATVVMVWILLGRRRASRAVPGEPFAAYPESDVLAAIPPVERATA